jgi:diacylglycerol O-acyltransferase
VTVIGVTALLPRLEPHRTREDPMEHLSPLDALFLDTEDEDRHASLAIASVAVVAGPAPSHAEFVDAVRGRLPLVPRYRQKARQLPFDLGQPVWIDDPTFDLAYHVRRTALPAPGDEAALCRLIGRIMSQRLDRDRPLWECWVVEGLAEGRWAILTKVHHCMADGVSGNELYRLVFDASPVPSEPVEDTRLPAPEPTTARLALDAIGDLVRNPVEQVRLLARGLSAPSVLVGMTAQTVQGLARLAGALVPVASSSLVGPIGQQRRYGLARVSLADIAAVAKAHRVTINDVVLAAASGAFRAQLQRDGDEPAADTVRALVPVSTRAKGDENVIDNRISMMLPLLPVDVADPVTRLRTVHRRMRALKADKEAEAGATMLALARQQPFAPISWLIRLAARLPQRSIVTVTTNVPGPRQPLYALGRRIIEILPYVPIAIRLRTGIAALTYDGQLVLGVTTDYDTGPDPTTLAHAIADGIAELKAAPPTPDAPAPRADAPVPATKATATKATGTKAPGARASVAKARGAKATGAKTSATKATAARTPAPKKASRKAATKTVDGARRAAPAAGRRPVPARTRSGTNG